jgi:predicted acetyltransferase
LPGGFFFVQNPGMPHSSNNIELRTPSFDLLPCYIAALSSGWSPNTTRDVSAEQLAAIESDAAGFLARIATFKPGPTTNPDGSVFTMLPGHTWWIWDGAFCGSINFRFQPDTEDLPPTVSGHVGYAVIPAKRGRGIATRALALVLPHAAAVGLKRVLVTCDVDNVGSHKVILANGGAPEKIMDLAEPHKFHLWISTAGRKI